MTCDEAQRYIKPYIRGELKPKTAADFAWHISRCGGCKDELEISYCVFTATKQLTEDIDFSGNYLQELNALLLKTVKDYKDEIARIHRKKIGVALEWVIIGLLLSIFF